MNRVNWVFTLAIVVYGVSCYAFAGGYFIAVIGIFGGALTAASEFYRR